MDIFDIIRNAREERCSDLHITCGTPVAKRRWGELIICEDINPSLSEAEEMIFSFLDDKDIEKVKDGEDIDVATVDGDGNRIRLNVYHQRNNLAASIRLLDSNIPTFESLGMDVKVLADLAGRRDGLVLVTGPTGSGKSTTLASMVNYINMNFAKHVITIEDPIEYVYKYGKAMIHQRQLGKDVKDFATALRSSLREDPDVLLVGEMRDYETINAAIVAAETGHLVLSTLHTKSAAATVERIISACPIDVQPSITIQLANVLNGVITQELVPIIKGDGRVAATEIMINTPAVSNMIREGKANMLQSTIQSNKRVGMHTLNSSLIDLYRSGKISRDAAFEHSSNRDELAKII